MSWTTEPLPLPTKQVAVPRPCVAQRVLRDFRHARLRRPHDMGSTVTEIATLPPKHFCPKSMENNKVVNGLLVSRNEFPSNMNGQSYVWSSSQSCITLAARWPRSRPDHQQTNSIKGARMLGMRSPSMSMIPETGALSHNYTVHFSRTSARMPMLPFFKPQLRRSQVLTRSWIR